MSEFDEALDVLEDLFTKDTIFALATSNKENKPAVRMVDALYDNEAFYVVTYTTTDKTKEIEENNQVAMARDAHRFEGIASNIGHPLDPENEDIRRKIIEAFEPWYFQHTNEKDEEMCYLRIELTKGFFYQNGEGYEVDFTQKEVDNYPYLFDVLVV